MHNKAKTARKAFFVLCSVIIFTTTLSPTLASNNIATRSAPTEVYVDPPMRIVEIGQNFTVNVNIFNVTNLYGYNLTLYYNTIILDGRNVTLPLGHFLTPDINPENISIAKLEIDDTYNATHGRVWFNVMLLDPEPPKNGSGTLTTIEFNATETGNTALQVSGSLNDPQANPIDYEAVDGSVIVFFEPPTILWFTNVTPPPNYTEPVKIEANVTDNVVVSDVKLRYSTDYGITWNNVSMNKPNDLYVAWIPKLPWRPTPIQYKIYAIDDEGQWTESEVREYTVADREPPTISDPYHYPMDPECDQTVTVRVRITKPENASPVSLLKSKLVYWNGSPHSVPFNFNPITGFYNAIIPALPWNTHVLYWVYAEDCAGNNATKPGPSEEKEYWVSDSYGPSISNLSHAPSSPQYNETVTVSANVSEPETGSGVSQVVLSYFDGSEWHNVTMTEQSSYTTEIPALPWNTIVNYKVYAHDNAENWATSDTRNYTVTDSHAPTIGDIDWSPKEPKTNKPVDVTASVSEPTTASGISTVILSYHDGSAWTNVTMTPSNGVYTAQIPGLKNATNVQFKIYARDNAGNWATSPVQEYTVKAPEPSMTLPLIVTIVILILVATIAIIAMRKLKI